MILKREKCLSINGIVVFKSVLIVPNITSLVPLLEDKGEYILFIILTILHLVN